MKKRGFTIIELLVVISIIVLLIGVMTPGVRKAKDIAMKLKQKSQLRDIGIGLELWYNEQDNDYPDSGTTGTALFTTGAHHLAEALVGRDGHGFDSTSTWNAEQDAGAVYQSLSPYSDRESTYLESDSVDNFQLAQVYGDSTLTGLAYPGDWEADGTTLAGGDTAGVLTDIFTKQRIQMPISGRSVKIGSPILYFKAKDTDVFDSFNFATQTASIFNYNDNADIFALKHNIDNTLSHPFDPANATGIDDFYDSLVNPRIRPINTVDDVPYNKHTFILLSAGADGLYGTKDDVTNISK